MQTIQRSSLGNESATTACASPVDSVVLPSQHYGNTEFDTTWQTIEASVMRTLHHAPGSDNPDKKEYMMLSTALHRLCTGRCAGLKRTPGSTRGEAYLLGREIYTRLRHVLETHVQRIRDEAAQHPNETVLEFYVKEWERYESAARANNQLFRYLNRTWVKREICEGKREVYDVYVLHVVVWKEGVVDAASPNVAAALVQLIDTRC